ncbi:MAG: glycosyltransferase family 87 protein [Terriglobales bacterium]
MRKLTVIAGALFLAGAVGVALAPHIHRAQIENSDFVNFYVGALIVHSGDGAKLYQQETQRAVLRSVLGRDSIQYFLHPPFEAAALAPLASLSFERAFVVWTAINVAVLALLPLVLMPCIPLVTQRPYVVLIGFFFLPVLVALTLGQDSITLLFIVSLAYSLAHKKMDVAAGLVLALTSIKFQYLILLIPLLLMSRKWRVVGGICLGCAGLGVISAYTIGWRGCSNYFGFVRVIDTLAGPGAPNPALMVNVRGFLAGTGWAPHSLPYDAIGAAVLLGLAALCAQSAPVTRENGLVFAVYIAVALTAAPYAHFPDATLLWLPILLAMDWLAANGIASTRAVLILLGCGSLFLWPLLLLALGGHYWWNSRIYLVFPAIVFFIVALTLGLRFGKERPSKSGAVAAL